VRLVRSHAKVNLDDFGGKHGASSSPSGAFTYFANFGLISACDFSISLILIGLSTNNAINAAAMSSNAARKNTACQSPVAAVNTLVKGTSSEAVPFAVYSMP
jgi:hypothetical protein